MNGEKAIETLYQSAVHSRVVVWDVGLALLAKLSETDASARGKLLELSSDRKAELRRRSIEYLCDRHSRAFCVSILQRLLADRSAKVRDLAASRVVSLNLHELQTPIRKALEAEENATVQWSFHHALALLENGYHYDDSKETPTLWLYFPDKFPARRTFLADAQQRFENGDDIDTVKAAMLAEHSHLLLGSRDWDWGAEL